MSTQGLLGDRGGAWATIAGTAAGILTHAFLAGVGLAALVMRSAELYHYVRLVGAFYLMGLGLWLLFRSRSAANSVAADGTLMRLSTWAQGRRAYVANVLNVKAASIYLTLAPQFVGAAEMSVSALVQLGVVHIVMMAMWLGLWSTGLTALSERLNPGAWTTRINAVGGAVLLMLGIRSAAQAR